jgi:hypothetical protein
MFDPKPNNCGAQLSLLVPSRAGSQLDLTCQKSVPHTTHVMFVGGVRITWDNDDERDLNDAR